MRPVIANLFAGGSGGGRTGERNGLPSLLSSTTLLERISITSHP